MKKNIANFVNVNESEIVNASIKEMHNASKDAISSNELHFSGQNKNASAKHILDSLSGSIKDISIRPCLDALSLNEKTSPVKKETNASIFVTFFNASDLKDAFKTTYKGKDAYIVKGQTLRMISREIVLNADFACKYVNCAEYVQNAGRGEIETEKIGTQKYGFIPDIQKNGIKIKFVK